MEITQKATTDQNACVRPLANTSAMNNTLLSNSEARAYQLEKLGRIVLGRDQLYARARAGDLQHVGNRRRFFVLRSSLDRFLGLAT